MTAGDPSKVDSSKQVSVNMADVDDDLGIEGDVLAAKRSYEDTSICESDGASEASASTESDAESKPEKRRRRSARRQRIIHLH